MAPVGKDKAFSAQQRQLMSEARKRYWANIDAEQRATHRARISEALRRRWAEMTPDERAAACKKLQGSKSTARDGGMRSPNNQLPPFVPEEHRDLWRTLRHNHQLTMKEARRILEDHLAVLKRRAEKENGDAVRVKCRATASSEETAGA